MSVATYPLESSVASYFYPSLAHHLMGHRVGQPRDTWIPVSDAADLAVLRLGYALRGFLETAEQQFCQRWPVHTSWATKLMRKAAIEYREELALKRMRRR